jgi:hypothetical protein
VVDVLGTRFGTVPDELERALGQVCSDEELHRLLRLAATVPSLEQFPLP